MVIAKKMIVSLIVAIAENNAIGKNNDLLWHLPNDMKFFKEKTLNHHIITGRKNYISIPEKYRPLVNRTNIVLTRSENFNEEGCIVKHNLQDAISYALDSDDTEIFIIGGGQIYKEALAENLIDKMYVTHVHQTFDADTFFPEIDNIIWKKTSETDFAADEKNAFSHSFAVYEKMN
jgi:dihydrofolate reductase